MQKISDDLITLSTMMMVAHDRGEIIHLANELNNIIVKAMELETPLSVPGTQQKTSSASIKFKKEEVDKMSKTFKKEFIANGCVAHIIKRPSGKSGFYYEIRYRRNGYDVTVSNKDLKTAKELFIAATHKLESPEEHKKNKTKFGAIADEWLAYKKGKIAFQTWQGYECLSKKHFPNELRERQIADIRTSDLDNLMRQLDNPRTYEDLRTVLNQVFKYAIGSGIITYNPVTLIPFKRAERQKREALTDVQTVAFLKRIKEPMYDKVRQAAYVFYFFGIRPCELDKEAHFENGFLICRNRKRKNGKIEYKKIPVPIQAQGLIDFDKPIIPPLSYDRYLDLMKKALGFRLTPYNLRHTFASICSRSLRPEIVEVWMGDSPERLVGKTYVHYPDDFMTEQMSYVKFPT